MVEDKWAAVDERETPRGLGEIVRRHVPRCETPAGMLEDVNTREKDWKLLEVLLVTELSVLPAEIAPLDAAVVPPLQSSEAVLRLGGT